MTWTHEGKPVGAKPRPWRLTRAQRVEMEAALARLRRDVVESSGGKYLAAAHWIMQAATYVGFRSWEHDYGSQRILRARVAIALRAALRADEDARCEAVRGLDALREWTALTRSVSSCWVESWAEVVRLRETSRLAAVLDQDGERRQVAVWDPVPHALWDR